MKMPPIELPKPDLRVTAFGELEPTNSRSFVMGDFFTAHQMRSFAIQYAEMVREGCARECERLELPSGSAGTEYAQCAAAIRSNE